MPEEDIQTGFALRKAQGLLCVPVQAADMKTALNKIARAGTLADLVELRLDGIPPCGMETLIAASPVPVLATVRSRREGGAAVKGPGRAVDLLLRALDAGADFVDVELDLPREMRRVVFQEAGSERVVLSRHVTWGTPSEEALISLLASMAAKGPGVVKIVCLARFPGDALRVLSLVPRARARGVGVSAFCMGAAGTLSRVLSLRLGATLGYASLGEHDGTAAGQIPIRRMRRMILPFRDKPPGFAGIRTEPEAADDRGGPMKTAMKGAPL